VIGADNSDVLPSALSAAVSVITREARLCVLVNGMLKAWLPFCPAAALLIVTL